MVISKEPKNFDTLLSKVKEYFRVYHNSDNEKRMYLKYIFRDELNRFVADNVINSYYMTAVRESKSVEYEIRLMPIEAVTYIEAILFTDGSVKIREIAPYEEV